MHGINNINFLRFTFIEFPVIHDKRENYNKLKAILVYLKWKDFEYKDYDFCWTK